MVKLKFQNILVITLTVVSLLAILTTSLPAQQSIHVEINRWLRVREAVGNVRFFNNDGDRAAAVGDLLVSRGDGLRTGNNSSSTLEVDTGVGTITLQENTDLAIVNLSFAPDDGRITHLYVSRGGVILNLRRFTHRGSELEIETPTGVSGVRGTEFGVIVGEEDGRTGLATRSGEVYANAQATEVTVPAGYQTLIRPGEPPLEPTPIPEQPDFDYRVETRFQGSQRRLILVGTINPINQAYIGDEQQTLNEMGEFRYEVPAYYGVGVSVRVVTPLGDETTYDITLL